MAIRLQFEADARKAKQEVASLEKSVANIDNTTKRATKTAGTLVSSFLLLGSAAVGLRSLTKAVDSFTRLNNRIALTTGRTAALVAQQQKLISVSKATRTSIDQTASLYSKLALNTNLSNKEALALTNTLQKAAKISGGTIQTTGAAITQLTQGLASGVLRGEELNSVLEGLPRVAQAIASELNVSVGQLRSIAAEGKLTAAVVQKALVSSAKTINTEFESINVTIGESLSLAYLLLDRVA
jgi:tape measure domain-containing protein